MEKRYSENTLTAYSKDLQQFSLFLLKQFDFMFKDVKHLHIRSFMVELMNDKISNRSVCRKLSATLSPVKILRALPLIVAILVLADLENAN